MNRRDILIAASLIPFLPDALRPALSSDFKISGNDFQKYPNIVIDKINRVLETSIKNGLSGSVVHFGNSNKICYQNAFGHQRRYTCMELMKNPEPIHQDTIFDLASMTKIFSTMLGYHLLLDRGEINLDDKVSKYLPSFSVSDKRDISLRLLLQHNSGFPSSFHFYNLAEVGSEMYSQNHDLTIRLLSDVPLNSLPGRKTIYSDLNFLTLGAVIEKIAGVRQDIFIESEIYAKLGLKRTGYRLLEKWHKGSKVYQAYDFAATERCGNTRDGHISFPNIRTHTIQGEVHDETAFYAMEQVSGNAGLFSTAHDLGVLCRLLLNEGSLGNFKLCSPEIVNLFRTNFNIDKTYALGWQILQSTSLYGSIASLISRPGQIVAHTGWTGTCAIIDFKHNVYFILLTNKRHGPVLRIPNYFNLFEGDITPAAHYSNISDLFFEGLIQEL